MRWVASVSTPDGLESDDGHWLIVPVRSLKVAGIVAWLLAPLPIKLVESHKPKRFDTLKEAKEAAEQFHAAKKGGA